MLVLLYNRDCYGIFITVRKLELILNFRRYHHNYFSHYTDVTLYSFLPLYRCSLRKRLPPRHEVCESVVRHCRLCSKVFWDRHGHPCIAESQVMDRGSTDHERVTSDKFITLFAW